MQNSHRPRLNWDDENEFLIPTGQPGSMMARLAAEQTGFGLLAPEHVVVLPPGRYRVIVIGDVANVEIVWRAGA
jgi:hypothetical protein